LTCNPPPHTLDRTHRTRLPHSPHTLDRTHRAHTTNGAVNMGCSLRTYWTRPICPSPTTAR
jgi:hypothetical protein